MRVKRKYSGWFAVSRQMFDHEIIGVTGPYSKMDAWLWLIAHANYRGKARGQLLGSRRFLAERWTWTEKAVRCFLERLEKAGMIECARGPIKGPIAHRITLCNYNKYQVEPPKKGPIKGRIYNKVQVRKITGARACEMEAPPRAPVYPQGWRGLAELAGSLKARGLG